MAAPIPLHLFEDWFNYTDAVTATYITDGAATVAGAFQGTATNLLIIYVMFYGWSMMRGVISEPVMDGVSRIIKMSFVFTFATNSARYSSDVAEFLYKWPSALSGAMSGSQITSTTQILDNILSSGLDLGVQSWQVAGLQNLGGYVIGIILFAQTCVVTAIAAAIIIISKFGLALLLALGPIFILMMLFDATRKIFDMWLGVVLTAGFTIVLVSMASNLVFKFYAAAFDAASANAAANEGIVTLTDIAPASVSGVIATFFLLGTPLLASGLGGGVSTASAGAAGWAYDKIKGASKTSRDVGKAGYNAGKNVAGRFNRGQSNSIQGNKSVASDPQAVYRKITSGSRRASRSA